MANRYEFRPRPPFPLVFVAGPIRRRFRRVDLIFQPLEFVLVLVGIAE